MKTATKLETEGDGSLVVNGIVVFSPSADFTAAQIRAVVDAHNSRAALAARVQELEAIISATLANGGFMTNENIFVARAALKGGKT